VFEPAELEPAELDGVTISPVQPAASAAINQHPNALHRPGEFAAILDANMAIASGPPHGPVFHRILAPWVSRVQYLAHRSPAKRASSSPPGWQRTALASRRGLETFSAC
jgi:hypothetical protein